MKALKLCVSIYDSCLEIAMQFNENDPIWIFLFWELSIANEPRGSGEKNKKILNLHTEGLSSIKMFELRIKFFWLKMLTKIR